MKRLKFLPSVLMLVACIAVLCVGVFSLTPTESTISGTLNISSKARVKISMYVDEQLAFSAQNIGSGKDWDLNEVGALDFDVSNYTTADQVPHRSIRIHIQNLTDQHLGVYFYNGQSSTLQTLSDGKTQVATYDSLKLTDAIYDGATKRADVTLSPYGYIAPANGSNTYDEYDMYITIELTSIDFNSFTSSLKYMLRIEEYQSNFDVSTSKLTSTSSGASGLQLVKLPTNNTSTTAPRLNDATYGCVVIPTSYTSISSSGLYDCSGLTTLAIPQSITSIGTDPFGGYALKSVDWHAKSITDEELYGVIDGNTTILNISSSVLSIHSDFRCPATRVTISSGITIGYNTINMSSSLTSVIIGDGATIGYEAFNSCSGLTSVIIGNNVSIGERAFNDCSNLTTVIIGNNVSYLGEEDGAFYGCDNLQYNIYDNAKYLGNSTNPYAVLIGATSTSITSITIPSGVTTIHPQAFSGCSSLTSVTIPNGVTSIGTYAFSGCSNLTSITIPNSVTSIGNWAFFGCSSLTSVTIPNSVTSIGESAFWQCSSLTSITIPNSVTSIGMAAFGYCSNLTSIYIPSSVRTIYTRDGDYSVCDSCSSSLVIYTGVSSASAVPSGWESYWNGGFTVKYGYTYERYLAEIGA